jgi:Domain of unknown function (DUF4062)
VASDSIHTVFISSTFEDLREERAEVQKAVLRLGCLPIGMELFPSSDSDAWDYIAGEIKRCDYYLLIVGGKYGSLSPEGVSFTEKEYRYAKELRKPCLVFVRSPTMLVSQDKLEDDDEKRIRLNAFISELNKSRLAQRFDSLGGLGGAAYYSLNEARMRIPVPGYIRTTLQSDTAEMALKLADITFKYETLLRDHEQLISAQRDNVVQRSPNINVPPVETKLGDSTFMFESVTFSESRRDKLFEGHDEIVIPSGTISETSPDITFGLLFIHVVGRLSNKPGQVFPAAYDALWILHGIFSIGNDHWRRNGWVSRSMSGKRQHLCPKPSVDSTSAVEEVRAWQHRPLERSYMIVYL